MTSAPCCCRVSALASLLAVGAATALLTFSLPVTPRASSTSEFKRQEEPSATPSVTRVTTAPPPPRVPSTPPPAARRRKREVRDMMFETPQSVSLCFGHDDQLRREIFFCCCSYVLVISRRTGGWRRTRRCGTPGRRYETPSRWPTTPTCTGLSSRTSPSSRGKKLGPPRNGPRIRIASAFLRSWRSFHSPRGAFWHVSVAHFIRCDKNGLLHACLAWYYC
jgi:hypothetical protein